MTAPAGPGAAARLFVAVWPPEEVAALVAAAVPRSHVPGLRWAEPGQWHVTLRFLGTVADAAEAAAAFEAVPLPPGPPPVAELGPAVGRFGRRVLHVPVSGLEALAAAFAGLPSPGPDRPFSGHLTLARARDGWGVDLRGLAGTPVAASFVVREVTLVQSHLRRGPAHYEVLARRVLASNTRL